MGIYGLWKGTRLNGWKFFFSVLFGYILIAVFALILFIVGNFMNSNERSFLSADGESGLIEYKAIHFSTNSSGDGEDFNEFINQFISDSIFQRDRTIKPYIYSSGMGESKTQTEEMDLYFMTNDDIFEGEKMCDGYTFSGKFHAETPDEIKYTRSIPETDHGVQLTFKRLDNQWMLVEYNMN